MATELESPAADLGTVVRVGDCLVHRSLNTIHREGLSLRCEPRVIEVLMCLIQQAPEPVAKADLLATVWPGTAVSDDVVWRCIAELRRAFGDSAREPRYIETIPRRGYRLIAEVQRQHSTAARNEHLLDSTQQPGPSARSAQRWRNVAAIVGPTALALIMATLHERHPAGPSRSAATFETTSDPSRGKRDFSSFEAYAAFSKGQLLSHRETPDVAGEAAQHHEEAAAIDPGSALAHAELARSLVRAGQLRALPTRESYARARQAARRALQLDPSLGPAHGALGAVLFWSDRQLAAAASSLRRALELAPRDARARRDLALLLSAMGRHEQASAEIEKAWRQDRRSPLTSLDAGWIYYLAGRFEDAVEECLFARDLVPESREVRSCLIASNLLAQRHHEALALLREPATDSDAAAKAGPGRSPVHAIDELLAAATSAASRGWISALDAARVFAALGHADEALRWVRQAVNENDAALAHLRADPCFQALRSDQRFDQLLQRLGLA